MDKLNILDWVLFFNQSTILKHLLDQVSEDDLHLGRAFTGDLGVYKYEYQDSLQKERVLEINKSGIVVCVLGQKLEVLELISKHKVAKGLFDSSFD